MERSEAHTYGGRTLKGGGHDRRADLAGPLSPRRPVSLIRWIRSGALVLTVAGTFGCQALPQLPPSTSDQSVANRVVTGAASSLCADAVDWLKAEPTREVRLQGRAPSAPAAGSEHTVRNGTASPSAGTRFAGVELVLRDLRDLPLPRQAQTAVRATAEDGAAFMDDPRSSLGDAAAIVEETVVAADLAYDIEEQTLSDLGAAGHLDPDLVSRQLPGYTVQKLYVDRFSGLKAVAFESRLSHHRIYAIAGTQVFINRDYRDWATGLVMARPQFVSNASLLLARDAADYARDPERGGEVFFTGQSQGAVISQALAFLAQDVLNARSDPHRLVHVVSWGIAGATEPIVEMITRSRQGYGRDVSPAVERHLSLVDPDHAAAIRVWDELGEHWSGLDEGVVADHVRSVARQMHIIGFFFDIDPFARIGTFLGQPLMLPTELVLPQRCEQLVAELVLDTRIGDLGVRLESHFLKGYRRAVVRGAVGLARPAKVTQREWVLDLLSVTRAVGRTWLRNIYLTGMGDSDGNWQRCFAARRWITDRNRDCRRRYWPGCDQHAIESEHPDDTPGWCLVAEDGAAATTGEVTSR